MSTKKPKYPTTSVGYFCYLHDYGAVITVNTVNHRIIQCITNSDGHDFRVDFILDKEYNEDERKIYDNIRKENYKIVNVRMY